MNFRQYSEKRDYMRMDINSPTEFRRSEQSNEVHSGTSINLSGSGIAFETDELVNVGEQLFVSLLTYGSQVDPLKAKTEVIRVTDGSNAKYRIAGHFLEVS